MVPEESDFRPPDGVAFDPNSQGPQSFYVPGRLGSHLSRKSGELQ
jgi:hypothetical protein